MNKIKEIKYLKLFKEIKLLLSFHEKHQSKCGIEGNFITSKLFIKSKDSKTDTDVKNRLLDSGRRLGWDNLRE